MNFPGQDTLSLSLSKTAGTTEDKKVKNKKKVKTIPHPFAATNISR